MATKRPNTETGLFLDGSGFCGWSVMCLHTMDVLEVGTFWAGEKPSPVEWGVAWLRIATFVDRKLSTLKPKPVVVGFEAPFVPPPANDKAKGRKVFKVNPENLRWLIGVAAMFEMVAARHGIRPLEAHVQTVKASLAGAAKKIERDRELDRLRAQGADSKLISATRFALLRISKEEMVAAAKARGWPVTNDHEADACGVGKVIIEERWAEGGKRVHTSMGGRGRVRR